MDHDIVCCLFYLYARKVIRGLLQNSLQLWSVAAKTGTIPWLVWNNQYNIHVGLCVCVCVC